MRDPIFKLKALDIPSCWKVMKNEFVDLEPDNNYPIDAVFYHFDEDLFNATYKDFNLDLGFYGAYNDNKRSGFFKMVIYKGDFHDGICFELFISRSTDAIRDKINFYLKEIPNGLLDKVNGLRYDDHYDHSAFHVYSAIGNIDHRLTDEELEEISKPKIV